MKKGLKVMSIVGLAAVSLGAISSLAACDKKEKFRIWCASEIQEDVQTAVDEFIKTLDVETSDGVKEFTDLYKIEYDAVSEADAATQLTTDVTSAGSVFYFPQDQLSRIKTANVLEKVSDAYAADVMSRNDESSVDAATIGGDLYAYPATADNGFFVYYNKTALDYWVKSGDWNPTGYSAQEVLDDQDLLIQAATDLGMKIAINLGEGGGWYIAGYFMGTECYSLWEMDDNGAFYSEGVTDNLNSAQGVKAMKGIWQLVNNDVFVNDFSAPSQFSAGALAVVDGTWDFNDSVNALASYYGPNNEWPEGCELGASTIWNYNVGEESFPVGTFSGFKLVGTKPESDSIKNAFAQAIANYLTGQEFQKVLLDNHGWGPSNLVAQSQIDYEASPHLKAFLDQVNKCSIPQGSYPDDWWNWIAALAANLRGVEEDKLDEEIQALLDTYTASMESYLAGDKL